MLFDITTGTLPAVHQLPPQQHNVLLFKMTLIDVNGGLASLSGSGGFRNYMKEGADLYKIPGSIQRVPTTRAKLMLVCTLEKFQDFWYGFIKTCESQGMFQISVIQEFMCHFPPQEFRILRSGSHHVKNGQYSSNEYDGRSTTSSADRELLPGFR
jgi:hypothetical protein